MLIARNHTRKLTADALKPCSVWVYCYDILQNRILVVALPDTRFVSFTITLPWDNIQDKCISCWTLTTSWGIPTAVLKSLYTSFLNLCLMSCNLPSQMLDRYEQHTLKCSSCRNAYTTFQTLEKLLIGSAVVFAATAGIPANMQLRIILGGVAIVSAALAYTFHELEKNFVFVDYVHAEIE